jgi:NADP-dependent 3-hydroxy acid dehydrogenase YdfG
VLTHLCTVTEPAAIAEGFVANGAKVYITGRRLNTLEATAKELAAYASKGGSIHV